MYLGALALCGIALASVWPKEPALAGGAEDPRRSSGDPASDIRSVTAFPRDDLLIHTVETYGSWSNSDLGRKGISIHFYFFLDNGNEPDRTVTLSNSGNHLSATLSRRHGPLTTVEAARTGSRSAEVRIPVALIEGSRQRKTYEWNADIIQSYSAPDENCPSSSPSPIGSASPSTGPSPSGSASPSTGPSPSVAPINSPTPSGPTPCGQTTVFASDKAPDQGRLKELFRDLPQRDKMPPRAAVRTRAQFLRRIFPWEYEWTYPSGGTQANVIADGFPTYSFVAEVRAGKTLRIRFNRSDQPRKVKLTAYPRLGPHNNPQGKKQHLLVTLRAVRNNGKATAWDVVFSLDEPARDYYLDAEGEWAVHDEYLSGGHASWSFHLSTKP
jgi:hypothetical protein